MYQKTLGIPENHTFTQTDTKWAERKGQDTDTYWYDEIDENNNIVAKYIVKDSTCIYPPQKRTIQYEKLSPDGNYIKSGSINPKDI